MRGALVLSLTLAVGLLASSAAADDPPVAAAKLPSRQANYAWDHGLLRASLSFRDVMDTSLATKLSSGLPTVIAMRAYVFPEGSDVPVALAVRTCKVTYDLWDEVYRIKITGPGGDSDGAAISTEAAIRKCTEVRDLIVVEKSQLTTGTPYYLGVIVDVNPISPDMLNQMRQWVSRPTGSTNIGPSDQLFGSFVGLFVRNIGTSDRTLKFRTQSVVP